MRKLSKHSKLLKLIMGGTGIVCLGHEFILFFSKN